MIVHLLTTKGLNRDYLKFLSVIPRKDSIEALHAPHLNVINHVFLNEEVNKFFFLTCDKLRKLFEWINLHYQNSKSDAQLSSYRACFRRNGLIRVETHRVNEEIFLNRHSQGKNSQTITQVKARLSRKKKLFIVFLFVCLFSFFKPLPLLTVIIS